MLLLKYYYPWLFNVTGRCICIILSLGLFQLKTTSKEMIFKSNNPTKYHILLKLTLYQFSSQWFFSIQSSHNNSWTRGNFFNSWFYYPVDCFNNNNHVMKLLLIGGTAQFFPFLGKTWSQKAPKSARLFLTKYYSWKALLTGWAIKMSDMAERQLLG